MKKLVFAVMLFISIKSIGQNAVSDSTHWTQKTNLGANFSQVGFSNWAGGGENSLALTGLMNYKLTYAVGIWSWENTLDIAYGIIQQGDKPTRKSDDKLLFNSKLGRNFSEFWSFTGILEFRSQFADGYKYTVTNNIETSSLVSRFMAPAYLTASFGVEYKPTKELSFYVTPITGKTTFVLDDSLSKIGAYGVSPGENVLNQFGILSVTEYNTSLIKNVDFNTKLTLFDDYGKLALIDVNWETLLIFTVNEYIKTSFSTNLVYDDDVIVTRSNGTMGKDVQFKEVIAIGLLYSF